jgi:4-diphosphocytidyl-2-C-methyl-D-erythritol kinase
MHGYHPICSYMHAIDLADEIEIGVLDTGEESRFEIVWDDGGGITRAVDWAIETDLVFRAHGALQRETGRELPCSVRVCKAIPAGGGLGGGSSDAASVLIGLDRLFGLGLGAAGLLPIAMSLGSDIGYFLDEVCIDGNRPARPAVVSGFGESIERVQPRHAGSEVTLILPGFGCATGAVYGAFDGMNPPALDDASVRLISTSERLSDALIVNDLTPAACAVSPALGVLIDTLGNELDRVVHVTGSGSTMFVLGRIGSCRDTPLSRECRFMDTTLV